MPYVSTGVDSIYAAASSSFAAKRYLTSFAKFVPARSLTQGAMVLTRVPGILSNFKTMAQCGLSLEQIKQVIAGKLAQNR